MATAAKVLAVCVNYNGAEVLGATLRSLTPTRDIADILVVDCASTDDSADNLPAEVDVLALAANEGYAAGLNAGIEWGRRAQTYEWFLLLNNDVELNGGALGALLESGHRHGPGVYGPLVLNSSNPARLDYAWGEVVGGHVLARYHGRGARADEPRWHEEQQVELLLGCALLVHRQVFDRVGLFDPAFFMYHEEVDFLFRCRNEGAPVVFCPEATVLHRGAWSTRDEPLLKVYWTRRNTILFLKKHGASLPRWAHYWLTLGGSVIKNVALLDWGRAAAIVKGVREGLRAR